MINPVFLKTFLSLSETKSFTKTALNLRMTQPGVSQHLKWLEEYFGVALIEREGKHFELTDPGHKLCSYGKSLFDSHQLFKDSLGKDDPTVGLCRFASPGSFGIKMYSFLLELNKKNPQLITSYSYAPNQTVIRDVLEDRIDVGFVTLKPDESALLVEIFDEEELKLIVPAKFSDLSFQGLKSLGFINHPDGFHHASRLFQENFPKDFRGMDEFPIRGFINQITRIPEPVSLGLGFTALPEFAYDSFTGKAKSKVFPLKKPVIDPVYKICKKHRSLPGRFQFICEEFRRWQER